MMKWVVSFLIVACPIVLRADISNTAMRVLTLVDSPRANGMGGCVATLVSEDCAYYNPGMLGILHADRTVAGSIPLKTDWNPELTPDMSLSTFGVSYGRSFGNSFNGDEYSRWSLGIAVYRFEFDYGTFVRTDVNGIVLGSFDTFDRSDCISAGVAWHGIVNVGLGANFKLLKSQLADRGAGLESGSGSATTQTLDIGMLAELSLDRLFARRVDELTAEGNTIHFKCNLSVGFVMSNLFGNLSYLDAAQADELPHLKRLGVALGGPFTYKDAPVASIVGAAELESLEWSFDEKYQKLGLELGGLGIVYVRAGKIDFGDGKPAKTRGFGVSLGGALRWLTVLGTIHPDDSFFGRLARNLDVSFDWAQYTEPGPDVPDDTEYMKIRFSF